MRREKRINSTEKGTNIKKMLYIFWSILVISVIGFIMTLFIYGNKVQKNSSLAKIDTKIIDDYGNSIEETGVSLGKTVNEIKSTEETNTEENNSNVTKYAVNTSNIENEEISAKAKNNKTVTKVKNESNSIEKTNNEKNKTTNTKLKEPSFKKPVEGEIIREFAKDKLVYSNTLEEWVTHNGIDIKANKTTIVKSAEEGTIKAIKNDPRYGLTVIIEHNNGFISIYSNLLTAEFVVEGEKIKQGQTIGTVGNSASFEIKDEPHLHFEIMKDGEYVDPELYLK